MIPYDDLVAALAGWRAKQGLPGSELAATPAPAASAGSGPASKSGPKSAPPGAPPRATPSTSAPMAAVSTVDDPYDVDDAALLEEASYVDEELGAFAALTNHSDEATSIGSAPGPTDGTIDEAMPRTSRSGSGPKSSDW